MSPLNFKHISASEQIVDGSITTSLLAPGTVTPSKMNIDANVNFNEFQALQFRVENVASNPAPGNIGRLVWNTTVQQFFIDDGSAFVQISGSVSGVASLQIDLNAPITGAIQFVSGTNISLSQLGNVVTINATASLTSANFVTGEIPVGAIDSVNTIFTLAFTPIVGTDAIYFNGVRLKRGALNDYTISGTIITTIIAPQIGGELLADYLK